MNEGIDIKVDTDCPQRT